MHLLLQKKPPHYYTGTYFFLTSIGEGRAVGTESHKIRFLGHMRQKKKLQLFIPPSKKRGAVRTWPNNALPGLRYTLRLKFIIVLNVHNKRCHITVACSFITKFCKCLIFRHHRQGNLSLIFKVLSCIFSCLLRVVYVFTECNSEEFLQYWIMHGVCTLNGITRDL